MPSLSVEDHKWFKLYIEDMNRTMSDEVREFIFELKNERG